MSYQYDAEITPEQQSAYIASRGMICPVCGKGNLDSIYGDTAGVSSIEISVEVTCNRCRSFWIESYVLSSIRGLVICGEIKDETSRSA